MSTLTIKPINDGNGTLQEYFNNAWVWAVVEKHPRAVDRRASGNGCAYKVPDGNCCLIGASWQELDTKEAEGSFATEAHTILFNKRTEEPIALNDLQKIHDGYISQTGPYEDYIESDLRKFAQTYNLTIPGEENK